MSPRDIPDGEAYPSVRTITRDTPRSSPSAPPAPRTGDAGKFSHLRVWPMSIEFCDAILFAGGQLAVCSSTATALFRMQYSKPSPGDIAHWLADEWDWHDQNNGTTGAFLCRRRLAAVSGGQGILERRAGCIGRSSASIAERHGSPKAARHSSLGCKLPSCMNGTPPQSYFQLNLKALLAAGTSCQRSPDWGCCCHPYCHLHLGVCSPALQHSHPLSV